MREDEVLSKRVDVALAFMVYGDIASIAVWVVNRNAKQPDEGVWDACESTWDYYQAYMPLILQEALSMTVVRN